MQITVPKPYIVEAKPAMEWLLGEPVQKVSPAYSHAFWQLLFGEELRRWGEERGRVGPEWRFWLTPEDGVSRYLVPDVAFVSFDRLPREAPRASVEEPHLAPDVIVEILSPRDRNILVHHKLAVYLSGGVDLVIVVDPKRRVVTLHDPESSQTLDERDILTHAALPGFELALAAAFAKMDR